MNLSERIILCHRCPMLSKGVPQPPCKVSGQHFYRHAETNDCPIGCFVLGLPAKIDDGFDGERDSTKGSCVC